MSKSTLTTATAAAAALVLAATLTPTASAAPQISSRYQSVSVSQKMASTNVTGSNWQSFEVTVSNTSRRKVSGFSLNDKLTTLNNKSVDYSWTCTKGVCPAWADGKVKTVKVNGSKQLLNNNTGGFTLDRGASFTATLKARLKDPSCTSSSYLGNNVWVVAPNGRRSPDVSLGSSVLPGSCDASDPTPSVTPSSTPVEPTTSAPTAEPTSEPTVTEPTVAPTTEPTAEPTTEPTTTVTPDPAPQPVQPTVPEFGGFFQWLLNLFANLFR